MYSNLTSVKQFTRNKFVFLYEKSYNVRYKCVFSLATFLITFALHIIFFKKKKS